MKNRKFKTGYFTPEEQSSYNDKFNNIIKSGTYNMLNLTGKDFEDILEKDYSKTRYNITYPITPMKAEKICEIYGVDINNIDRVRIIEMLDDIIEGLYRGYLDGKTKQ